MKLRNDRYRKVRGGKAKLLRILCARYKSEVIQYQKDGDGALHRCYLNRITNPGNLVGLDNTFSLSKEMRSLICPSCSQLIGTPMKHTDGRLAFRLMKGDYSKSVVK